MQFDEVYTRYFSDVYRYLLRLSGSEDLAQELASETFFRALGAIGSFRGECSLYAWLCQIAKNCFYSYVKKSGRVDPLDDETAAALPDPHPGVEETAIAADDAARVRTILHTLPEPYKEVFLWRVFAELPFDEIGALFGKTANWACVTFHRARKMIIEKTEESK